MLWCLVGGGWGCSGATHDPQWLVAQSHSACEAHLRAAAKLESSHGGIRRDAVARVRLNGIGKRLEGMVNDLKNRCRFELLDCDKLNALSLPGGSIYITRGLYARLATDELLAAAIAHELAHVAARDGLTPCRTDEARLAREIRADDRAAGYLVGAGFNPRALLEVLATVEDELKPGWAKARMDRLRTTLRGAELEQDPPPQ